MKNNENLYLVLGCFGRCDDGFISCKGIENKILKISQNLEGYQNMMDYFSSCRLFDRPLFELNAVRHLIFNLQDKYDQKLNRLWSEKNFHLYQKFIIDHRPCGVFIKLILEPEQLLTKKENADEDRVLIKAIKTIEVNHKQQLKEEKKEEKILTNLNNRRFRQIK